MRSTTQKDYLYITNENEKDYVFKVYIDDVFHSEHVLSNKSIAVNFALILILHNCNIRIEIFESEFEYKTHSIKYDRENDQSFIDNGYIQTDDNENY